MGQRPSLQVYTQLSDKDESGRRSALLRPAPQEPDLQC
jgi:hypothetical protein